MKIGERHKHRVSVSSQPIASELAETHPCAQSGTEVAWASTREMARDNAVTNVRSEEDF